jgi:hypothetical protein
MRCPPNVGLNETVYAGKARVVVNRSGMHRREGVFQTPPVRQISIDRDGHTLL